MADPTKEELKEAQEIWVSDELTSNADLYMFDCGHSHTEHAIALIAVGLAHRPEPYRPTCEVHRDKARDLAMDPDSLEDPTARNLARAFRLESDARRSAELERDRYRLGFDNCEKALDKQINDDAVIELERNELRDELKRLQGVIVEIDSLETQARSGDAGHLLEAEAKKIRAAQGGIVFSETSEKHEVRAVIDSEGNARLYPDRKAGEDYHRSGPRPRCIHCNRPMGYIRNPQNRGCDSAESVYCEAPPDA